MNREAVVLLPYSVRSYKLTEFYALAIPIFVPSIRFFRTVGGFGADRTATSAPYCVHGQRHEAEKDVNVAHPFSPNAVDADSESYWLQFADFYDWPHVTTFNDGDDLRRQLDAADLNAVEEAMRIEYEVRKRTTLNTWCEFIANL